MYMQNLTPRLIPPVVAEQSTILSNWVVVLYRMLLNQGLDAENIFLEEGIKKASLFNPGSRLSHPQVTQIWNRIFETTGDPSFPLKAADAVYPGMIHTLSHAMCCSASLGNALGHLVEYRRLLQPLSNMQLTMADGYYKFTWGPRGPYVSHFGSLAVVAAVVSLCRQLAGFEFAMSQVSVSSNIARQAGSALDDFFGVAVNIGKDENALYIEKSIMEKPLYTANTQLENYCLLQTRAYLAKIDESSIVNTVYCKIAEMLPTNIHTVEIIADELHLSRRTLQRRLKTAGISFDTLVNLVRKELALSYLSDPTISIQEVAWLIGYKEPGNFSRAFKHWMDVSPSEYREAFIVNSVTGN
jgi:AraC-like DNA-binding protein